MAENSNVIDKKNEESGSIEHSNSNIEDLSKCGLESTKFLAEERKSSPAKSLKLADFSKPAFGKKNVSVANSETQTDISALPSAWKSEGYITNKNAPKFTTLPSKFSVPIEEKVVPKQLKLSLKTPKARRILLSDINFTSMVPELSRSVDQLCETPVSEIGGGSILNDLKQSSNEESDGSQSFANNSQNSISKSPFITDFQFHFTVKPANATSTKSLVQVAPQFANTRRTVSSVNLLNKLEYGNYCNRGPKGKEGSLESVHGDVPTIPNQSCKTLSVKGDASFRQSLPNIFGNCGTADHGTPLTNIDTNCNISLMKRDVNMSTPRRFSRFLSESNLNNEFCPPITSKPFIARSPAELRQNYYAKVINRRGRIVCGKIAYVGESMDKGDETRIGLILPKGKGESDGSYMGNQYFACDRNDGIFVPFKKVVMAWKV